MEWDGKAAAAASKLEWMMQQTSSALALEKIDDNGMVLNGWLARIHHGQKKRRASPWHSSTGNIKIQHFAREDATTKIKLDYQVSDEALNWFDQMTIDKSLGWENRQCWTVFNKTSVLNNID